MRSVLCFILSAFVVFVSASKQKRSAYAFPDPYPQIYPYFPYQLSPVPPLTAVAELQGDGIDGRIMFLQNVGGPVLISGNVTGLKEGLHGMHVHEFGDLMDGCKSFGMHFNPTFVNHGGPADPYRHVGDLGNIKADSSGTAKIQESDHLISLGGPNSIIGRGLVIHENKDDFGRGGDKESLRTGNAGERIACGTIALALPPPPFRPHRPPHEPIPENKELNAKLTA